MATDDDPEYDAWFSRDDTALDIEESARRGLRHVIPNSSRYTFARQQTEWTSGTWNAFDLFELAQVISEITGKAGNEARVTERVEEVASVEV